ncbi:DUF6573 family protein [Streptomyces sp. NPDC049541]|uniref:DUF6573 family protein n=1 Tax=Streptomyces sp. NPDC049541 TaxID=3365594 RepID=UPI00378E9704
MTTIRRNWTNRVAQIRAAARSCRAYDSATGNMVPVDPARAFEAWETKPRARLTEDTPGQKWTVHVHSNEFYTLTAEAPATSEADPEPTDETPAPTGEPSPAGAQDRRAARVVTRRRRTAVAREHSSLPGHLPALAVDLVGKTVRVKLAQGYSHEQIRDQFEQERAQAQAAGDTERMNGLATMLAVHAVMAEEAASDSPTGPGSNSPQRRPASPRAAREDDVLAHIDSVLHDAAVTGDPTVSDDAMRSVPLAEPGEIIHAYTRAQALADGVLVAADADLAREAGFRVPVALTSAVWEGCVAWNEGDSERQVPQDERGRLWDVLTMTRHAIRRSGGGGGQVTVDLRRVPRDGRTRQARPVQLICAIGPGDHGEPVITIMQPDED